MHAGKERLIDLPNVGKRIHHGQDTPTSAAHVVVTGLAFVDGAVAGLDGQPTLSMMFVSANIGDQEGNPAAGSIIIKSTRPMTVGNINLVDSIAPWGLVNWIAVGKP